MCRWLAARGELSQARRLNSAMIDNTAQAAPLHRDSPTDLIRVWFPINRRQSKVLPGYSRIVDVSLRRTFHMWPCTIWKRPRHCRLPGQMQKRAKAKFTTQMFTLAVRTSKNWCRAVVRANCISHHRSAAGSRASPVLGKHKFVKMGHVCVVPMPYGWPAMAGLPCMQYTVTDTARNRES